MTSDLHKKCCGRFFLPDNEVHVWQADLALSPANVGDTEHKLSPDERERWRSFRHSKDAMRFAIRRAVLRELIAMYVDRNPAELEFRCGPQGKPSLSGEDGVSFNISQSGSLALYAIVRNREVGVDLESVRPELADDGVAKLVFSSTELSQLGTLPAQDRCAAFFTCWTKKEAYVKATGEGFAAELASLTVHAHDGPVVLKEAGGPWFVRSIPAALGYAAAVAADGTEWTLRRFDWPPLYSPLSAEPSAHRR